MEMEMSLRRTCRVEVDRKRFFVFDYLLFKPVAKLSIFVCKRKQRRDGRERTCMIMCIRVLLGSRSYNVCH